MLVIDRLSLPTNWSPKIGDMLRIREITGGSRSRWYFKCELGLDFDLWFRVFQAELALQSGSNVIPKGMDKESYRDSYIEGMTPAERATQELDDLSR